MFWDDRELTKKRGARIHLPPPIPETGWVKPEQPPNLSNAAVISFDCETKDLFLHSEGPGWARGKAHVVGVSIGVEDRAGNRGAWYFPVRHEVESADNLDPSRFFPWLGSVLDTPNVPKVGANLTYDIGNLAAEGVKVSGPLNDIQFAEALIDDQALVALEILARKYVGIGKDSDELKNWCRLAYPHTPETHWRSDIYRTPPRLTAPYAISDATLPIDILKRQWPILVAEELMTVYRLECDLIPLMIAMRFAGIPVDVAKAENMIAEIEADTRELYQKIYHEYGYNLQSSSSGALAGLFDHVGIRYPLGSSGKPSITKQWLAEQENPLTSIVNDIREHEKMVGTFLKGYVLNKNVNGRLFPQFHQLKGDENGTSVGRFASSDPNLQNIPARTKLGKKIRTTFVKEPDHAYWLKMDQSQVHYRILAHFAVGPGAEELRYKYNTDPATDYHWNVYMNVAPLMGWDTSDDELNEFRRRPIKNVNFGLLYGQSQKSLAAKVAMYFGASFTDEQIEQFFEAYFEGAPYVKPTMKMIGREVQAYGFVTTLLGRRVRFHEWEPASWDKIKKLRELGEYIGPLPYERALRYYGPPLRIANEYRGVNYKFQGSEPDIIKKGMLDCWNSGVFNVTGVPRVTVHDEINWSIPNESREMQEAIDYIQWAMTNCIKLRVPLKVDKERGPSWGEVKKVK